MEFVWGDFAPQLNSLYPMNIFTINPENNLQLSYYGKFSLQLDQIAPITNGISAKPKGGLWSSPVNSVYGWADFCRSEEHPLGRRQSLFTLKEGTRVLVINSSEDLHELPFNTALGKCDFDTPLDYEAIAKFADAIHLTLKGRDETIFSEPHNLCDWNCETVLILNSVCIELLETVDSGRSGQREDHDRF